MSAAPTARGSSAVALALLKSAGHDGPLLYPGPLCGGESGTTGREAGVDSFSPAQGCAVEKPGPGSRTCRPWMGGKRQAGWPSLLVTFLLATQEKSNSGASGARNALGPRPPRRSREHAKCRCEAQTPIPKQGHRPRAGSYRRRV